MTEKAFTVDMLLKIDSKEDFITFLRQFQSNLISHPDEWENPTLERFLEAMESWLEDLDESKLLNANDYKTKLSWSQFAQILVAAKYYE